MATVDNSIKLYNETNSNYMQLYNETNNNYLRLSNSINNTSTRLYNTVNNNISNNISNFYVMEQYIIDASTAQQDLNEDIKDGQNAADRLLNIFKGMAGTIGLDFSLENILALSDQMATTKASLASMVDESNTVEELQKKIFQSAERSRGSYLAMADAIAKMGTMAKDAFGGNDEIIAFTEQLNKHFVISGTSAQDIDSTMSQLTQSMAQGVLSGEELNSIFIEVPTIIQAIAGYMGIGTEEVINLAQEGQITADIFKNAMFSAANETNAALESMPMTWAQIFTSVINKVIMVSQPLLEFISLLASNWSILEPIILSVGAAILTYLAVTKSAEAVTKGAELVTKAWTAAQAAFNAVMVLNPIAAVAMIVMLFIGLVYAGIAIYNKFAEESVSATGMIVGVLMVAAAIVLNIFIGVINLLITWGITLWNFILSFAEFFKNVFNDPVGSIVRLFSNMADAILGVLEGIAGAADTLFGSNLAASVAGWRSELQNMTDDLVGEAEIKVDRLDASAYRIDGVDYGEAYKEGYDWGSKFSVKGVLGGVAPQVFEGFEVPEGIGEGIDEIAANTTDMRDSMEISEEDLKYMRDIAEREVIDRTVLRDVKLEVSNSFGDVRETADVDGIITRIEERLVEAIDSEAEGDYNV
ncbi:tape measure protein [Alkaliphilus sp. B6464]|uniref:tape measure protein n=1 Tax=Alkaliphilus sp. B6464 TaxID=2731219 RepID=UPI001BAE0FE7|nr:tape measure protein [Alkaliphilus sp. B6464]QUH18934.1 tape measure protein [Alkaliphilus sp. B6464]